MIWNETKECMSRDELHNLQSKRLVKLVEKIYLYVPYYRNKMQQMGIEPGDIKSIDDINKLPFTTKEDIRENYPTGMFVSSMDEVVRIHASSGTTGKPTVVGYTKKDLDTWKECVARVLYMAEVDRKDLIQVSYGYGLFTGGLGLHYGAENIGATVIPTSTADTRKQIMMMKDLGCTSIACTPSYMMHLSEIIEEENLKDEIKLKSAILGGEPWTENMRLQIEEKVGLRAYDIYGLSEIMGPGVAADCEYHKGLHIYEDHFYPEIIDPDTLGAVGDNEIGELVITTLTKEAFPLIRYRTRDLTSMDREICECGRTMSRIQKFVGRSDDMLVIKGVNVFPSQIESALLELGETKPYYLIIVDRVGSMDSFEVWVEVEERFFSDEIKDLENLRNKISAHLSRAIGLKTKVKLVEPKTIERTSGKSNRVVDRRKLV